MSARSLADLQHAFQECVLHEIAEPLGSRGGRWLDDAHEPRIAQAGILDDELVRVVVGMKIVGEIAQVMHQGMNSGGSA